MNGHNIGLTLKEIMRRIMEDTHERRIGFVGKAKINDLKPGKDDLVTDADYAAQAIALKKLRECFPGYGIVAEEDGFNQPCTLPGGTNLFFTVDPLDGTKAYGRKQSHGFGPMISLCTDDEVIAAFVGDVMSGEIFYYRPESSKVHRLSIRDDQHERLEIDPDRELKRQYVLLRDNPQKFPEPYRQIIQPSEFGGMFQEMEIMGGGIGVGMARLWKGEVGAYVVLASKYTPWDLWPVWGLSKKLGFIWLAYSEAGPMKAWLPRNLKPSRTVLEVNEPTIVIHVSRLSEFMDFASKVKTNLAF